MLRKFFYRPLSPLLVRLFLSLSVSHSAVSYAGVVFVFEKYVAARSRGAVKGACVTAKAWVSTKISGLYAYSGLRFFFLYIRYTYTCVSVRVTKKLDLSEIS